MTGRILLVDPDRSILGFQSTALSHAGFDVIPAHSGEQAISLMDGSIDVVITALRMPEPDGTAVLAAALEKIPDPVVVVSVAATDLNMASNLLHAGAFDTVIKPGAPVLLVAAAQRAVDHRILLEERRVHTLARAAFRHLGSDRPLDKIAAAALDALQADTVALLRGTFPTLEPWHQATRDGAEPASIPRLVELSAQIWQDRPTRFPNPLAADLRAIAQPIVCEGESLGVLWGLRPPSAPAFGASDERRCALLADQIGLLAKNLTLIDALGRKVSLLEAARDQLATRERAEAIGRMAFAAARHLRDPVAYTRTHLREALSAAERLERSVTEPVILTPLLTRLRYGMEGLERVERIGRDLDQLARSRDDMLLDLRSVVEHAVRMSIGLKQAPQVEIPEVQLRGNAGELAQALIALLENADRATPDSGPPVRITGELDGDSVSLSIIDVGHGMTRDQLTRMFTPFEGSWGRAGLGCPMAKQIIEKHGGRVEVSSRRGRGTRVTLTLPAEATELLIACGD